ncbi:MAG: helix-turn-helix domain-containing protein [Myxococcota bacterium]
MSSRLKQVAAQAILEAAEQIFAEDGAEARMEDIASRAGVAVGTLYNHFQGRGALIDALMEERRRTFLDGFERALGETSALPFAARLERVMSTVLANAEEHAKFRRRMLEMEAELVPKRLREFRERWIAALEPLLAQGRSEGVLAEDPTGLQPILLMGIFKTMFITAIEDSRRLSFAALPQAITRAFLRGASR